MSMPIRSMRPSLRMNSPPNALLPGRTSRAPPPKRLFVGSITASRSRILTPGIGSGMSLRDVDPQRRQLHALGGRDLDPDADANRDLDVVVRAAGRRPLPLTA